MNIRLAAFVALLGLTFASSTALASGFRLPEQSASAMGMSSAFVGQADDPSATWYNPAGLTQLDGTQISGGVIAIYPSMKHDATTGFTDVSEREIHLPIHLYATHKYTDRLAVGLGINYPFGLSTDWAENSSVKYVSTFSKVMTTNVNPNVAYKVNDDLSVAFGIDYTRLRATLEKTQSVFIFTPGPVYLGDYNFRLSGDGDGWGMNVAAKYRVSPAVETGLSYRSRIKVDLEGTAELTGAGPAAQSGSGNTSITLPDLLQVGVSYKASDDLRLNADIEYTFWSTYDRIVITSDNPTFDDKKEEKNWRNTWSLRLGTQYRLSDAWKLRAGYIYDQNPVDEEYFETGVPDSDRQALSVGAGHTMGNITIDVAYLYLRFHSRGITDTKTDDATVTPLAPNALNGPYKSTAHLAGITIGYKF